MILYLGTSCLVKLYVDEASSSTIREWAKEAEILATCRVAYTEAISAIENRFRGKDLSKKDYELLMNSFSEDWNNFVSVDFDEHEAGNFVKKYGLRRLDAIHLSAAKLIKKEDVNVAFFSFDTRLNKAAADEGLKVLDAHR